MEKLYRIRFNYPKGKFEYFQDTAEQYMKPYDSKKWASHFTLEQANKIKEEYDSNPFKNWEEIILEVV